MVIVGVILGGVWAMFIFYQPAYYLSNPAEILAIWQGGMAFHGGLLGVVIAGYLYTGRHKINRLSAADVMALGVPPGLLLGRLSNFINAELWADRQTCLGASSSPVPPRRTAPASPGFARATPHNFMRPPSKVCCWGLP